MSRLIDKSLVLNSLKKYYEFKSDKEFAQFLGIAPTSLSSWYARNSINWDVIFSKCVDIDFDNLIKNGIAINTNERNTLLIASESSFEYGKNNKTSKCELCDSKDKLINKFEKQLDRQEKEISRLLDELNSNGTTKSKRNSA